MNTMSKAEIILRLKNCALSILADSQNGCAVDADKEKLAYTVAFNDGVLDLLNIAITEIVKYGGE